MQHLLEGFLPLEFTQSLDFTSLELKSGNYLTPALNERHQDLVWSIEFKSEPLNSELMNLAGQKIYLYLLLEFQSKPDPKMAVRILSYTAAFYEQLIKSEKINLNKSKLPLVFPFVLYTGKREWRAARQMIDLLPAIPKFLQAYQGGGSYFLLSTHNLSNQLAQDETNLIKRYYAIEKAANPNELVTHLKLLIEQIQLTEEYQELARSFSLLLRYYFRKVLKAPELVEQINLDSASDLNYLREIEIMANSIQKWEAQLLQQGWHEGEERGFEIALKKHALSLRDNLNLTAEKIAEVLQVPLEKVKQLLNQKP